jgi:RHS repeat-associated protein
LKAVPTQAFTTTSTFIQESGSSVGFSYSSLVSSDGASHILASFSSTGNGWNETVDGTGLQYYNPTSGSSFAADSNGTRFSGTNTQEDSNGNQFTLPGLDTVGRNIPFFPTVFVGSSGPGNCPTGPLPVDLNAPWVVPGPNNGTSTFLLCWAEVNVVTVYDVTDGTQTSKNIEFLQSLVLPNGTAWTFQYSNDGFGDLTEITFPTGGTISYVWENGSSCMGTDIPPRWLASRTVNANDGAGNHTWTYSYGFNGTAGTTTVADPLGNNTVYTNGTGSLCSAYTTSVQYYQGSVQPANLLKTVSTTYSRTASPFANTLGVAFMNIVPTQITTTWANGKTSMVTKTYDSGFTFPSPRYNDPTQYTGLYGKVTVQKEYDYGTSSGQPGPLLKQTNTNYAWQSPNPNSATYLNNNMLNLVHSTQITDGTTQKAYTQYGYDETAAIVSGMGPSQNLDISVWTGTYRGNQTSVNRWRNLPSVATLASTTTYYDTGMPSVAKDPLLNSTTYYYSGTFQDAYVTQVKNALNQSTYYNYDYDTGLKISTTDPNGQITSDTYDADWRLTNVTRPTGGGQTSFCYSDESWSSCLGSPPYQVVISKEITSAKNETATAIVDGLGRLAHTQLNSDPEGIDYVDDSYDGIGNKATTSNPYRTTSDSTYGISTNVYDALHRVTQVTQADGSLLKTAYCGNTTLVTDEAGHWRRSTVDGLGRLIEVDEPNSTTATVNSNGCPGTGEPIWVTTYGYDTLGNLLGVLQAGSRARTFTYDSLSRILSSINPESNTVPATNASVATIYTYDADGNLSNKTTPAQNQQSTSTVTLTYCYDSLNRMTAKGYGSQSCTNGAMPTPIATYSYDGSGCLGLSSCFNVGHRTGMTDQAGSESWAYDAMGRTGVQSRTTNSLTKTTSYTYNLDSSAATLTYPSGRVMTYTPDTAGRPSNVEDNTTSVYYATGTCANNISGNGVCYAPQGGLAQINNGTSLVSTHIFNNRLQPCWMYSTTGTALATNHACTDTATAGNMLDLKYNFNLGADNGNPISITNNLVSDRTQTFSYDQLNRVATAQTTATHSSDPTVCWGQAFAYDSTGNWSNLLSIAGVSSAYSGCTQNGLTAAVNAFNRLTGVTYDTAGNVINDGTHVYAYNQENQLCNLASSCASSTYIYDGDGNRVEKSGSKIYWMAGGQTLDETDTTGSVTNSGFNEYVFFGGTRIARRDSFGNVFYYLADQLGTSRKILQAGQIAACYDADFEPFGGEHVYVNTCPQNYKFTGKERDSESGLDNFGARYNASSVGWFISPDPKMPSSKHLVNPQKWNQYAYVLNNPLAFFDPDGMEEKKSLMQAVKGIFFGSIDVGPQVGAKAQLTKYLKVEAQAKAVLHQDISGSGVTTSGKVEGGASLTVGPISIGPKVSVEGVFQKDNQLQKPQLQGEVSVADVEVGGEKKTLGKDFGTTSVAPGGEPQSDGAGDASLTLELGGLA